MTLRFDLADAPAARARVLAAAAQLGLEVHHLKTAFVVIIPTLKDAYRLGQLTLSESLESNVSG